MQKSLLWKYEHTCLLVLEARLSPRTQALVNFRSRAYLPWPDLPVTHTGFSDPPPFRLLY